MMITDRKKISKIPMTCKEDASALQQIILQSRLRLIPKDGGWRGYGKIEECRAKTRISYMKSFLIR